MAWAGISNIEAILFEIIPERNKKFCSNIKLRTQLPRAHPVILQKRIWFQFSVQNHICFGLKEFQWKAKLVNEKIKVKIKNVFPQAKRQVVGNCFHIHLHSSYLTSKKQMWLPHLWSMDETDLITGIVLLTSLKPFNYASKMRKESMWVQLEVMHWSDCSQGKCSETVLREGS